MALRTQYEFLFVGKEDSFVENYAYDLSESEQDNGKIFITLEIQNNPAEAELIGETIFDTLRKTFFADLDQQPYLRFEEAVKAVNKALFDLKSEKASQFIGNLHIILSAIVGNNLFLAQCGEAEAYLIRRRFCSIVTEGLHDEKSQDVFTNIASGTLEVSDFVLFSSTRLLRYISKTDLTKICVGKNLVAVLGELKDFLMTEVLARVGFIGIMVSNISQNSSQDQHSDQVVTHLEKEEVYPVSARTAQMKDRLDDTMTKFRGAVGTLKRKLDFTPREGYIRTGKAGAKTGVFIAGRNWSKTQIFLLFCVFVSALLVGTWWIRAKNAEEETIQKYDGMLVKAYGIINEAAVTRNTDKQIAETMLNDAEKIVREVLQSDYHHNKATVALEEIQNGRDQIYNIHRIKPAVLGDIAEKRANARAIGLLSLKDELYIFEENVLYPVQLNKIKDPVTINVQADEKIIAGTTYDDKDSLLFYTQSGKLIEYKDGKSNFLQTVDSDGFHTGAVALQSYSNKIYILDPAQNQVWRYTRRQDKFSGAEAYNTDADIKNGTAFAIDGSIYVLHQDAFITKFYSKRKIDFQVEKEPLKSLSKPTKIFTHSDMDFLYILGNDRVMVYKKDNESNSATYDKQYVFQDLKDLKDLYVDQDAKKLYILDTTKIYDIPLE